MNLPAEILAPSHSAVLVVDMQNDFVSSEGSVAAAGNSVGDIQAIVQPLAAFLDEARAHGLLVVHIQTITLTDHLSDSDAWLYNKYKGVGGDFCLEGTWGAEIIPECRPLPGEPVVTKHRSSAFVNTRLNQVLQANRIRTVIVTGEQTPGCVEATFRDAAYYDYYNVLVSDCIAAYRRDLHEASLLIQRARHDVYEAQQIIDVWHSLVPPGEHNSQLPIAQKS